jgi:hypothetical protein
MSTEDKAFFIKYRTHVGPQQCVFFGDGKNWPQHLQEPPHGDRLVCFQITAEMATWPIDDVAKLCETYRAEGGAPFTEHGGPDARV